MSKIYFGHPPALQHAIRYFCAHAGGRQKRVLQFKVACNRRVYQRRGGLWWLVVVALWWCIAIAALWWPPCGAREQVEKRVYFYKSARLVKKGLIRLTNDRYQARDDLTDMLVRRDRRRAAPRGDS